MIFAFTASAPPMPEEPSTQGKTTPSPHPPASPKPASPRPGSRGSRRSNSRGGSRPGSAAEFKDVENPVVPSVEDTGRKDGMPQCPLVLIYGNLYYVITKF